MEQNCDVCGKMCEFWWLLRIEKKNRKNVRTMVARGARMTLIAKNAPYFTQAIETTPINHDWAWQYRVRGTKQL